MQELIQGVHRFHHKVFSTRKGLFERLVGGQHPEALFITCSDSRIDTGLLTQSDPGDLFVLRNAGNIVPPHGSSPGEEATIEYAVNALGIRDIVLCGHSHCGAIKALLNPEDVAGMPAVARWLEHAEATRRIVRENYGHLEGDRLISAAVQENVLVQIEHICTLPAVAAKLARGDLRLHGWVYKFETGQVFAFDPEKNQFLPLSTVSEPPPVPSVARQGTPRPRVPGPGREVGWMKGPSRRSGPAKRERVRPTKEDPNHATEEGPVA